MNRIQLFGVPILVDVKKTADYYNSIPSMADESACGCVYCCNYVRACESFSDLVLKVFQSCGINPRKEGEFFYCCQNDDGTHCYEGFYHFVGEIQYQNESNWYQIDNFEFAVTNASSESAGVAVEFPKPVVELAFRAYLPWVLDESL